MSRKQTVDLPLPDDRPVSVIGRKLGQGIVIGEPGGVEVWICRINKRAVQLLVRAPEGENVARAEVAYEDERWWPESDA